MCALKRLVARGDNAEMRTSEAQTYRGRIHDVAAEATTAHSRVATPFDLVRAQLPGAPYFSSAAMPPRRRKKAAGGAQILLVVLVLVGAMLMLQSVQHRREERSVKKTVQREHRQYPPSRP